MRFGPQMGRKLLALTMLLTSQSHAVIEKQYPNVEETNRIAHSLLTVLTQCPDRIWPNLKVATLDTLLINKELSRQILISPSNQKISTIANENLPSYVFSTTFSLIPLENRNVLYADSQMGKYEPSRSSMAFNLAIHEAFHMMDQSTWKQRENNSRGAILPLLVEPRIARSMLYKNLVKAYGDKTNASTYLGKAKYWYEQWLKADASEADSTTDGYEGSARYVETIATLLDQRGCSATEAQLEKIAANTEPLLGEKIVGFQALDTEGYYVGALASLILRFQFPEMNWQVRLSTGETPVEILLEKINAIPDSANDAWVKEIRKDVEIKELAAESYLKDTRRQMEKESAIYVSVPGNAMKTSYSPKGFFNDRKTGVSFTPMAKTLEFTFNDKESRLKSKGDAVFFNLTSTSACAYGWDFVVDSSEIQSLGNNRFESKHKLFEGSFKGELKRDSQGRQWLCVQE